jgi:lipopolysaccharide assembly outer membrane protein LptD (OstA)
VSNRFLENRERPQAPDADAEPALPLGEDAGKLIEGARDVVEKAAEQVRQRPAPEDAETAELPDLPEATAEEIVSEALARPVPPTVPPTVEPLFGPSSPDDSPGADEAAPGDSLAADSTAADSAAVEEDDRPEWLKTPSDQLPTENLLFGEDITMHFAGNELEKVVVIGAGRSKFFPSEESGELSEWNDVVGDTLNVWFTASSVDSVHVLGSGVGEYRFPAEGAGGSGAEELRRLGKLVDYQAPRIRYLRNNETMHLDEGAQVKYKTMTLTSGTIDFDANKETMTAAGDPPPVLVDEADEITGSRMNYHLPSGKGEIRTGRTQFEAGYYDGRDVWKMGDDVLAVDHARFTTCDLESPHYHFDCRQMKIYLDDKMVARPVVLRIGHIPVFALPFYMTSLRKDRHSGFLLPNLELGVDDARGRFIRNLGYYWAPNDYTDLTSTVDYYPARDQFIGYLTGRYNLRYRFQGEVRFKYNRDASADRTENAIEIRHTQEFDRTTRLTADASFLSSNSIYQEIDDANRLNRDLRSHATFTKQLAGNRNLLVDVSRQENLDTGSLTETLPNIQFTQPSVPITGRQTRGAGSGEESEPTWLDGIYWKLDGRAVNQRRVLTDGTETKNHGSTADGRLTTTQDASYLRFSPAFNFEGTWIGEDELGKKNPTRATYNGSLTARTDVYGTFPQGVGPVQGFRHVIRPSVSWSWAPEFREYFYRDSTGVLRDRFASFGGIRGTQRKTNSMNFSLGNLVQTKVLRGESENRYDLFNVSSNISYNFLAKDNGLKPLSNLNNSLTILSASPVNQSWSVVHDPYTWELISTRITTRASLGSRMFQGTEGGYPDIPPTDDFGSVPQDEWDDPVGGGRQEERAIGDRYTAGQWDVQVSHTQSTTPSSGAKSSHLVLGGTWSPTARWRLRFDYDYDLRNGENTSQQLSVQRTIHCWELSFDRRLLGGDWQYYLRINVTDLPDLQVERGDRTSGRGFGTSRLPGF